ncbi:tetratricopeptide repeat protein [Hyphococcus formosus]|uniref:hypothetical protein n=1 Tax=Hyphococcus formosus TaxID=3143534 RepID=UPI00398A9B8D
MFYPSVNKSNCRRAFRSTLSAVAFVFAVSLPIASATADPYSGQTTLLGDPLRAPDFPKDYLEKLELDLAIAQAAFEVAPDREDSYIWLGRRYGYLGRNAEAIDVFTRGLAKFPNSYKLHRFRGRHRARNRDFDGAIADYKAGLSKMKGIADSFEPDGAPNAIGLTISTYRSNLHYYLGQTSFATGNYQQMIDQLELSTQSPIALPIRDHEVAVVFWQYIAMKKLGLDKQAAKHLATIPQRLDLIENHFYHRAVKVLQGRIPASEVLENGDSLAKFALGMKLEFEGERVRAKNILRDIVKQNALGYWPAEVELIRMESD